MLDKIIKDAPPAHPIHKMSDAHLTIKLAAGPDKHGRIYLTDDLAISARWSDGEDLPPELSEAPASPDRQARKFFEDEEKLRASRAQAGESYEVVDGLPYQLKPVDDPTKQWLSYEDYSEWATGSTGGIFTALLGKCRSHQSRVWASEFRQSVGAYLANIEFEPGSEPKFKMLGSCADGTFSIKFEGTIAERDRDARFLASLLLYVRGYRYGPMIRREHDAKDALAMSEDEMSVLGRLREIFACRDMHVAVETQTIVGAMSNCRAIGGAGLELEPHRLVVNALVSHAVFTVATILCAQQHAELFRDCYPAHFDECVVDFDKDDPWGPLMLAWEDDNQYIVCPASPWRAALDGRVPDEDRPRLSRSCATDSDGNPSEDPILQEKVTGKATAALNRASSKAFAVYHKLGTLLQKKQPLSFSKAATKTVRIITEVMREYMDSESDRFTDEEVTRRIVEQCEDDDVTDNLHLITPPHYVSLFLQNAMAVCSASRSTVKAQSETTEFVITSCLVALVDADIGMIGSKRLSPTATLTPETPVMAPYDSRGQDEPLLDLCNASRVMIGKRCDLFQCSGDAPYASHTYETLCVNAGLASIVSFLHKSSTFAEDGCAEESGMPSLWGYENVFAKNGDPSPSLLLISKGLFGYMKVAAKVKAALSLHFSKKGHLLEDCHRWLSNSEIAPSDFAPCLHNNSTVAEPFSAILAWEMVNISSMHVAQAVSVPVTKEIFVPANIHSVADLLQHHRLATHLFRDDYNEEKCRESEAAAFTLAMDVDREAAAEVFRRSEKTEANRRKKGKQKESKAKAEAREAEAAAREVAEREQAAFEAKVAEVCSKLQGALLRVDDPWDKEKEPQLDPLERLRRAKKQAHEAFADLSGVPELKTLVEDAKVALEKRKPKKERAPPRPPPPPTPPPPPPPEKPPEAPKKKKRTGGKTPKYTSADLREKPKVAEACTDPAQAQSRLRVLMELASLEDPQPSSAPASPSEPPPQPPDWMVCGITHEVFVDPVVMCTGQSYERSAVEQWLSLGNRTDPLTGEKMAILELRPNYHLRSAAQDWVAQHGRV